MNIAGSSKWKWLDFAAIFGVALLGLVGAARVGLKSQNGGDGIAVVFAPWVDRDTALLRSVASGARFVRYGRYWFIAVVMPDDAGYVDRMLSAGALIVTDPLTLSACEEKIGIRL